MKDLFVLLVSAGFVGILVSALNGSGRNRRWRQRKASYTPKPSTAVATSPTARAETAESRYRKKPVLTETERSLYYTLAAAVDGEFLLFSQVQLTGFMRPEGGRADYAGLNQIHRKSVDFLLCDKNGNAVVAIELQDWTHNREDRKRADAVKARALMSAGVPLIEFHAEELPSVAQVNEKLSRFRRKSWIPNELK